MSYVDEERGTGYVNLQDFLGQNQAGAQQMSDRVTQGTQSGADWARAALMQMHAGPNGMASYGGQVVRSPVASGDISSAAYDVQSRANAANAPGLGGLSAVIGQDYRGGGAYNSGMGGLDAFLARSRGADKLANQQAQYGGYGQQTDAKLAPPAPRTPYPTEPPAVPQHPAAAPQQQTGPFALAPGSVRIGGRVQNPYGGGAQQAPAGDYDQFGRLRRR